MKFIKLIVDFLNVYSRSRNLFNKCFNFQALITKNLHGKHLCTTHSKCQNNNIKNNPCLSHFTNVI